MKRFDVQRGGPSIRVLSQHVTIEEPLPWAVIDTQTGHTVRVRPIGEDSQEWFDLRDLLNDIYEEGKRSNG